MKIAAVTMVYNEATMLPWWLRHYSRQVGESHCYVIDQASDDGSTTRISGANTMRVPVGTYDEAKRADFISDFCASLLKWYDWIIYTDVDEMLVADPACYTNRPEH